MKTPNFPIVKKIVVGTLCASMLLTSALALTGCDNDESIQDIQQSIATLSTAEQIAALENKLNTLTDADDIAELKTMLEQLSTAAKLAEHENIVAIKEASGNISQIAELAHLVGDKMDIYSGNDDQIVPILSLGGKGVISVLSNPMPRATSKICHDYFEGNHAESLKAQLDLLPFINSLFSEVNPIPVKAAMAEMGYCENTLRLPLTEMEEAHKEKMVAIMKELSLI